MYLARHTRSRSVTAFEAPQSATECGAAGETRRARFARDTRVAPRGQGRRRRFSRAQRLAGSGDARDGPRGWRTSRDGPSGVGVAFPLGGRAKTKRMNTGRHRGACAARRETYERSVGANAASAARAGRWRAPRWPRPSSASYSSFTSSSLSSSPKSSSSPNAPSARARRLARAWRRSASAQR